MGVHPDLAGKILNTILPAMTAAGKPMFVVVGVRTAEEQHARFLQVPKVTNADGYLKKSHHQVHGDGYGHAVDCAFVGPDPYADGHDWGLYGEQVHACGLGWGGTWKDPFDRPHAELVETPMPTPTFEQKFLTGPGFDKVDHTALRTQFVDFATAAGPLLVIQKLQAILKVGVDGVIGPETLTALNAADPVKVNNQLMAARIEMIGGIVMKDPSQLSMLGQYLNRALQFLV